MSTEVMPQIHQRRGLGGRLYHGETAIDFYGRRWWGIAVSSALLVVTFASLLFQGLNLGIDFEGGVAWEVSADNVSVNQARSILDDHGINGTDAKVQQRTSASGSVLLIQVGDQSVAKRQEVQEALATRANVPTESVSVTSVSSTWGRSITEKAVRALIIFLILVALFIAWRLEWRMALSAIVAMLHDVLISIGVYSVLRFEVTPATVVAFLTILGFSLYDTIVVFDKVKDNAERYSGARMPYADVVNVSMNQVLMRSINTTIAAVLPVLSLLILGAGVLGATTLREFSLALLVGLITGSYSSIFIASPLLAMLKEREPRYRMYRGSHATGAELERLVLGGSPAARRDAARLRSETAADEVVLAATPTTPQSLLTHPPRPRKKKRRTS
ncbi:MAG TPA: protein translocase subunit SecF [Ilumatobacteraceae bacterium]|nr:protein translocase subunit SecF [Ilumatobacteraceae bacterium]